MERQGGREGAEAALVRAWAALRGLGGGLVTQEGERVEVVSPGVPNPGPGPDFRGAALKGEGGRLVRGSVELHGASSAWKAHGHQRDSRYNRVVLHVVGRDDTGRPTELANGARVPVLVLYPPGGPGGESAPPLCGPCRAAAQDRPYLEGVLVAQGWLRFGSWVWGLVKGLGRGEPDQVLYARLLEGLGYPQNRGAFRRLAAALPWGALRREALAAPLEERRTALQALLLGAAGLLEPPAAGGGAGPIPGGLREVLLARWRGGGGRAALKPQAWQLAGTRPWAHPWLRLAGMGALLARWLPEGPVAHLLRAGAALAEGRPAGLLRRFFHVPPQEAGGSLAAAPLGPGKGDVLAVNGALPFLSAWSQVVGDGALGLRAEAAYRAYPGLERDSVVRRMGEVLGLAPAPLGACQQQGLHRLFRRYCLAGRQERCPLGGGKAAAQPRGRLG